MRKCAPKCHFSHIRLFAIPWTVARQSPLPMGFSRQEHWSGLPFPSPGDFPNLGMETLSLRSPALAGGLFTASATWEAPCIHSPRYHVCQQTFGRADPLHLLQMSISAKKIN